MDNIEKLQKNKTKSIAKFQDNKELSIKTSSTIRDAVLIVTAQMAHKEVTPEEIKTGIQLWREWLWNEWDSVPKEPERPPYSEEFLLDALERKTYKSDKQKSFYEFVLKKWYGGGDDDIPSAAAIREERESLLKEEGLIEKK